MTLPVLCGACGAKAGVELASLSSLRACGACGSSDIDVMEKEAIWPFTKKKPFSDSDDPFALESLWGDDKYDGPPGPGRDWVKEFGGPGHWSDDADVWIYDNPEDRKRFESRAAKTASDDLGPGSGGVRGLIHALMDHFKDHGTHDEIPHWVPRRFLTDEEVRTGRWMESGGLETAFASLEQREALSPAIPLKIRFRHEGDPWEFLTGLFGSISTEYMEPGRNGLWEGVIKVPEESVPGIMAMVTEGDLDNVQRVDANLPIAATKIAGSDPWLITLDDEGNTKEYTEFDDESVGIARGLVADHTAHGGIFFVPDCPLCVEKYGPKGERWGKSSSKIAAFGIFREDDKSLVYGPSTKENVEIAFDSGRYKSGYYMGTLPDVSSDIPDMNARDHYDPHPYGDPYSSVTGARDQKDTCKHCKQAIDRGSGQGERAWRHVDSGEIVCDDGQEVAEPGGWDDPYGGHNPFPKPGSKVTAMVMDIWDANPDIDLVEARRLATTAANRYLADKNDIVVTIPHEVDDISWRVPSPVDDIVWESFASKTGSWSQDRPDPSLTQAEIARYRLAESAVWGWVETMRAERPGLDYAADYSRWRAAASENVISEADVDLAYRVRGARSMHWTGD